MRILIITTFFPPLNSIASQRPLSWAKYWSALGNDVTVLTTKKSFLSDANSLPFNTYPYHVVEVPYPFLIEKLKRYNTPSANPCSRTTSTSSFFKKQLYSWVEKVRETRGIFASCRMPDLSDLWIKKATKAALSLGTFNYIISTAGPYAVHCIANKLKKRGRCSHWAADYRDLWVDSHLFPGIAPFNRIESWLEKHLMKNADSLFTVSAPLAKTLQKKYPSKPVYIIENGYEPDDYESFSSELIFPDDGLFRLVYTGKIYPGKRDPSPLFQAIAELSQDENYCELLKKLKIIFAGWSLEVVNELAAKFRVQQWIENLGPKDRTFALEMQKQADGLLLLEWADPSAQGVFTGKIFEYLAVRRPIWGIGITTENVAGRLIQQLEAGKVFGNDVFAIKEALIYALQQQETPSVNFSNERLIPYQRRTLAEKMLQKITEHYDH